MALMKGKDVPKDAVVMDEVAATTYAWNLVDNWDIFGDSWALRYGSVILGSMSALSGAIINNHYRTKLKLGNYGYLASIIPITAMPALLTTLFHRHLIATDMLLMKTEACPICYEVKSAALQWSLGVAYPMLLAPSASFMLANRYGTFRIPDLLDGPKVLFTLVRKITRPFNGTLAFISAFHIVTSSVIAYFEMKNNFVIRRKLLEIEKMNTMNNE